MSKKKKESVIVALAGRYVIRQLRIGIHLIMYNP